MDRDDLIVKMMERKKKEIRDKKEKEYNEKSAQFRAVMAKIYKKQERPAYINNTYEITNPDICPDIARGEAYIFGLKQKVKNIFISRLNMFNRSVRKGEKTEYIKMVKCVLDETYENAPPLEAALTVYRGVYDSQN